MQKILPVWILTAGAVFAACCCLAPPAHSEEIIIDAVAASVNGNPITLHDINRRLRAGRKLSLEEASHDPEARQVLEMLIMQYLIIAEAERKKISASEPEIEEYVNSVAGRNNMSREEFEKALTSEGASVEDFKRHAETDIIRSKIASSFVQGGIGVSDSEVDRYLEEHPESIETGPKIKLRQIFIASDTHSEEEAKKLMSEIKQQLEAGRAFEEIASLYSEGPEAQEGGLLGVLQEKNLSASIFDAVFSLKADETSDIVQTSRGFHIFKVDERFSDSKQSRDAAREQVRQQLHERKLDEKMSSYFATEIYKYHTVDKKI